MKDIHNNRLLDQARFEIGTEVQLFQFSLDKAILYNLIMGAITGIIVLTFPQTANYVGSAYLGAFILLTFFYIKYGTN